MRIIETTIGANQARLKLFLHEDGPMRDIVVICPGGGYLFTAPNEGDPVALKFTRQGYHAAVLDYSTTGLQLSYEEPGKDVATVRQEIVAAVATRDVMISQFPRPLTDLAQAIDFLAQNREGYQIKDFVTAGFSAGANLVAQYGVYWDQAWLRKRVSQDGRPLIQPKAQIVSYGYYDMLHLQDHAPRLSPTSFTFAHAVIKAQYGSLQPTRQQLVDTSPAQHLGSQVPPTFIWHTAEDTTIYVEEALAFSKALQAAGVPWELHIYTKGRHGLSLADDSQTEKEAHVASWFALVTSWLNYYQ